MRPYGHVPIQLAAGECSRSGCQSVLTFIGLYHEYLSWHYCGGPCRKCQLLHFAITLLLRIILLNQSQIFYALLPLFSLYWYY